MKNGWRERRITGWMDRSRSWEYKVSSSTQSNSYVVHSDVSSILVKEPLRIPPFDSLLMNTTESRESSCGFWVTLKHYQALYSDWIQKIQVKMYYQNFSDTHGI